MIGYNKCIIVRENAIVSPATIEAIWERWKIWLNIISATIMANLCKLSYHKYQARPKWFYYLLAMRLIEKSSDKKNICDLRWWKAIINRSFTYFAKVAVRQARVFDWWKKSTRTTTWSSTNNSKREKQWHRHTLMISLIQPHNNSVTNVVVLCDRVNQLGPPIDRI